MMVPAGTGTRSSWSDRTGPSAGARTTAAAPKYTMFLPATSLLADIKAGEHPS